MPTVEQLIENCDERHLAGDYAYGDGWAQYIDWQRGEALWLSVTTLDGEVYATEGWRYISDFVLCPKTTPVFKAEFEHASFVGIDNDENFSVKQFKRNIGSLAMAGISGDRRYGEFELCPRTCNGAEYGEDETSEYVMDKWLYQNVPEEVLRNDDHYFGLYMPEAWF